MIENKRKIRIIGVMVLAVIVSVVVMSIAVKFGTVNNINISTVETSEKTTDSGSQDTTEYDETRPDPEHYGETKDENIYLSDEEYRLSSELAEILKEIDTNDGESDDTEEYNTESRDDYEPYNTPLDEYGFYNIDDFGSLIRIGTIDDDYVYGWYDNVEQYSSTNYMMSFTGDNIKYYDVNSAQDIKNLSGTLTSVLKYEIVDNDTLRIGNLGDFILIKERKVLGNAVILVLNSGGEHDYLYVPQTMLKCDEAEDFDYREDNWHPRSVSRRYKIPWK